MIGQTERMNSEEILTFEDFLVMVKAHHPIAKQADLTLSAGEATLLKARGGFDPKVEVDYDRKKFKGKEYYDRLNATFKIPTWYGIEFKANFEENTGEFLDPSQTLPENGLYSAGVSFSLAQGFLINERMADLKKARFFLQQSEAERRLIVNDLLFEASKVYFEWVEATLEAEIYTNFLENANTRLKAVERSVEEGEKAEIDITEASIIAQNRILELEIANLKKQKARLIVSNYLWLANIPLEIEETVKPKMPNREQMVKVLSLNPNLKADNFIDEHPKINALQAKINGLEIERRLKRNKLLPKVDLQYNFLSTEYDQFNSFNTANYKAYVNMSVPIFLRKERGDVKLANFKFEDATFELNTTRLALKNKVLAIETEISSLERQILIIENIVLDYEKLLTAEQRKFQLGESSLFLINNREQKLIDSQLKQNTIYTKHLNAIASLFNALGKTDLDTF